MKKILLAIMAVIVMTACKNTNGGNQTAEISAEEAEIEDVVFNPHSFLMTEDKLPQELDLNVDISDMTMMELRLLRNYPYAMAGMWFMEHDLNGFFNSKTDWYYDVCYKYMEEHDWEPLTEYSKAKLSDEEQAFVARVDERIAEIEKQLTVDHDGLKLSNPVMTVNMFQLEEYDQKMLNLLGKYNFAIMPTNNQQLFNIYEENDYSDMPNYITTDVFLQAYHMYFSYVLKYLEEYTFIPNIHQLNMEMHSEAMKVAASTTDPELKELAEFNAAYFAVADKLLADNNLAIPASFKDVAEEEIKNIYAMEPTLSHMMRKNLDFPYDLFKPRGHYTRKEESRRYFRSMMWLQSFSFCREDVTPLKQTVMMAYLLNHIDKNVCDKGLGVYKTLDFLMGEPDNVAVIDIAEFITDKMNLNIDQIKDMKSLEKINEHLQTLFKTRNRITSKIAEEGCEDKINFMPQRYMPDSYVLSRMLDEKANSEVPFPRGLDVFAAFGVKAADQIIDAYYKDAEKWDGFNDEMAGMKKEFENFKDWDKSMYNKWFESLVQLQNIDKDYPDYMKTSGWSRKNLNTALASWAELKHDAILYGEQPMCAECGDGEELPRPDVVGYVEPNLDFWKKMKEMLGLTRSLLEGHGLMDEELSEKTERLEDYMDFCIKVSEKELAGKALTSEEYNEIKFMGSSIEWFTLSVLDPDPEKRPDTWGLVEGPDRSVAVVADVFTRNVIGCDKCGILYEATGNADEMYVIVNIGGKIYLTRGAVFSYYEFVNPLGNRLTDEEWQEKLEGDDAPGRPQWMLPVYLDKAPVKNEQMFYSSGC